METNRFEAGYYAIYNEIIKNSVNNFYFDEEISSRLAVEEFQVDPKMLEQREHFSEDVMLAFYQMGVRLYQNAQYEEGINAFIFLTHLSPEIQSFWTALGLCYEKNLEFVEAINCYEKAIHTDPTDFSPFYSLIRCSMEIKDYSKAKELLHLSDLPEVETALNYIKNR